MRSWLTYIFLLMVACGTVLTSCSDVLSEEGLGTCDDRTTVRLTISFGGDDDPMSRDVDSDPAPEDDDLDGTTPEQAVIDGSDVYALVVDANDNFLYRIEDLHITAGPASDGYYTRTLEGTMIQTNEQVRIVLLANLKQNNIQALDGTTPEAFIDTFKGQDVENLYNQLIYNYDGTTTPWTVTGENARRIPMWGQSQLTTVPPTPGLSLDCYLYRAVAKVQIWVDMKNGIEGFVIKKIEVKNIHTKGYCVSSASYDTNNSNYTTEVKPYAAPSVPDNAGTQTVTYGSDEDPLNVTQTYSDEIYIPERFNTDGNAVEIDVYYTINNVDKIGTIKFDENIIRNYSYIFNIKSVREQMQYTADIKPWSYATKNVEIIVEDFHWLYVKDKVLYMNNINEIKTTFDSSTDDLTYTISDVKVYNTNTNWNNNGGNEINFVTIDKSLKGEITINSVIPDNFVGKEFKVTVSSATSGKSETIQVYQFPPLYLTLQQNNESVDAGNNQTNSSVYEITTLLADFSWLPENGSNLELSESGYTHNGSLTDRRNAGTATINFLKNCKFGYPQTEAIHYNSVTSNIYNDDIIVYDIDANTTVETSENGNLISPHFILASQGGANSISDYNAAKQNCAGYSETVRNADGTTTTYGKGSWRVPTKGELMLIDLLQNISKSQVKKILEGEKYIYTKNPTDNNYNMMDPRVMGTHAVRCVRDIK